MIGFRCTAAGGGAGVDGVENAADRFPLTLKGEGEDGRGGSSGIVVRDGGVNGAPNIASSVESGRSSGWKICGVGFRSADSSGVGAGSFWIDGVNFGEKGGVRCRTGDCGAAGWLGAGDFNDGAGGAAGVRSGGASVRGTGGGQLVDGVAGAGVRGRAVIGFTPDDTLAPAATGAGTAGKSSPQLTAAPTGMSPPQIEQRALIDTLVIFAGSNRKTDRHSGQETFIGT